jgi:hypothetical protein
MAFPIKRANEARRSELLSHHRSASRAPAIIHLIPLGLFLLLALVALNAGRTLARPLINQLEESWRLPADSMASSSTEASVETLSAFTPEVQRWGTQIDEWANTSGLPPALIATVIQIESCGDPRAQSPAGALGLFQVMPYHFDSSDDPLAVAINARAGLSYLQRSYQLAEADISRTLAGYNGGHGVIHWPPSDWPQETQRYAAWGTGIMLEVQANDLPSPTLSSWLDAGGAALCRQAAQRALAAR